MNGDERAWSALDSLQVSVGEWRKRNFGYPTEVEMVLGVCEEAGELAHAALKGHQGIRGFADEYNKRAAIADAVGDICIFLMGVCDVNGWLLSAVMAGTAGKVLKRDWVNEPRDGGEKAT